jgi:hypothetical protein
MIQRQSRSAALRVLRLFRFVLTVIGFLFSFRAAYQGETGGKYCESDSIHWASWTVDLRFYSISGERKAHPPLGAGAEVSHGVEVVVTGNHVNRTAPSGWMVRLVRFLGLLLIAESEPFEDYNSRKAHSQFQRRIRKPSWDPYYPSIRNNRSHGIHRSSDG